MTWYHVAEPNSYLVVTGVGIEKVKIQKKVSWYPSVLQRKPDTGARYGRQIEEAVSAYLSMSSR